MAHKIKKQTNETSIFWIQFVLFLTVIGWPLIFVVMTNKKYEYRCSNCHNVVPENGNKCYTCKEDLK